MALQGSFGGGVIGKSTATAATAFYTVIPPYSTPYSIVTTAAIVPYTVITHVSMTNGNTANATTVMRPIGRTTAAAAASTGVNTITISGDPGNNATGMYNTSGTNNNIAANDIIVVAHGDGSVGQYTVGAYNTTSKVVTVTASGFTVNVPSGAYVWDCGINSDTDPITGVAFPTFGIAASTGPSDAFLTAGRGFAGAKVGDPLVLYNPNATAQTILNYTEFTYDRGL